VHRFEFESSEEERLPIGFVFIGAGIALGVWGSGEITSPWGEVALCGSVGILVASGLAIAFFHKTVVIDSEQRRVFAPVFSTAWLFASNPGLSKSSGTSS
jgi:hypothetical protein